VGATWSSGEPAQGVDKGPAWEMGGGGGCGAHWVREGHAVQEGGGEVWGRGPCGADVRGRGMLQGMA
jgi:hypothetical protein